MLPLGIIRDTMKICTRTDNFDGRKGEQVGKF